MKKNKGIIIFAILIIFYTSLGFYIINEKEKENIKNTAPLIFDTITIKKNGVEYLVFFNQHSVQIKIPKNDSLEQILLEQ